MDVLRDTTLELGYLAHPLRPPQPALLVVAKATFVIPAGGGTCTLADEQVPCHGDVHHDDDPARSVRLDSDFALYKPRAECFLVGTCHAPSAAPVPATMVRFAVGRLQKTLAVIGDRHWLWGLTGARASDPVPFTSMPLCYERSFGGSGHPENPFGRGLDEVTTASGRQRFLPNIEDPKQLIGSQSDRPAPAGAFPVARDARGRIARAGTYDARWQATRWPWLPEDFDPAYFNAAPLDQQFDGAWDGTETIELVNLRPGEPQVRATLPGLRPRCVLALRGQAPRELGLRFDTVTVDADAGLVHCLWRTVVEVASEELEDVAALYLAHDTLESPRSSAQLVAAFEGKVAPARSEDGAFAPEQPQQTRSKAVARPPRAAARDPQAARAEVLGRRARCESLVGAVLEGADLRDLDLRGIDLSKAILRGALFSGTRLDGALLDGAQLAGAVLDGAILRGTSLRAADLTGVSAQAASFPDSVLEDATFERGTLVGADFRGAAAGGVDFTGADLTRADFSRASLAEAELVRARLEGALFEKTKLHGASLDEAIASRARFDGSDLTGLRARRARFDGASLLGVKAPGAHFAGAVLTDADLSRSDLSRADFVGASLARAVLDRCVLRKARLKGALLAGGKLRQADAFEADFEDVDLTEADLRGASLFGAELWKARWEGARLTGANLGRTKLEEHAS
jgi:uncharacterized protein YjbI with pentapeptide repeats